MNSIRVVVGLILLVEMFDFWLISVPADPTCEDVWKTLSSALAKYTDCACFKFYIPFLKVGTFDQLLGSSEELTKLELTIENLVSKIASQLDVLLEGKDVKDIIQADNDNLYRYLITFKWDMAKYPVTQTIKTLVYMIERQISKCDAKLTAQTRAYNNVLTSYSTYEKKLYGNLMTRFIGNLVSKEDFVLDSEFMTTLVVVVLSGAKHNWLQKYERLDGGVLPKSTKMIVEDDTHALYTVTVMKSSVESFKTAAKDKGFFVRDFVYNEDEIHAFNKEKNDLSLEKMKLHQPFFKFCKTNFSECFISMVHVKAMRIYVESTLRYGLSTSFQPILLVIRQKISRKVRKLLNSLYSHLDPMNSKGTKLKLEPHPLLDAEYYPYVFIKIKAEVGDILGQK